MYKFEKERLIFDKPFYLGFCVLELSVLLLYMSFFKIHLGRIGMTVYNYSACLLIVLILVLMRMNKNFLKRNKNQFDFSELCDITNKKVIDKREIETKPILVSDNSIAL